MRLAPHESHDKTSCKIKDSAGSHDKGPVGSNGSHYKNMPWVHDPIRIRNKKHGQIHDPIKCYRKKYVRLLVSGVQHQSLTNLLTFFETYLAILKSNARFP